MNFIVTSRYSLHLPGVTALSLGALAACGPGPANLSILAASQGTYQGSTANNKVDILWVIDNSGSMLTKQQNLANGFDSFSEVFVSKDFDFHMAIVTTDTRSIPVGQAGEFQGSPTVITNTTPNFSSTFQSNVVAGSFGDPSAKALDVIQLALDPGLIAGANAGFLRSDAHLAVIVLSDADDNNSSATTASVIGSLQTLKPDKFDVLTRTYKKNFTISAVVVDTSNTTNTTCPLPYEDGVKFKTLANATNGSIASICENNFAQGLTNLSQRIAEAITEIPLGRTPNVSTIVISFNGNTVPKNATNGWSYSSSGNKIIFHGSWIPEENTTIGINYIPNDIIR